MSEIFFKKNFLVRETTGLTNLEEAYQILDAETKEVMLHAVEESSMKIRLLKLFLDKSFLPCTVHVKKDNGLPLFDLYKSPSLLRNHLTATLADGKVLCHFRQKFSVLFGNIEVTDGQGQLLGMLKGDWKNRFFSYYDTNNALVGTIKHVFGGFTRELFTTSDDYEVELLGGNTQSLVMLAATLSVDLVYHED